MPAPIEKLTLQENALAASMVHHMGDATVRFALDNGIRHHEVPAVTRSELLRLIPEYGKDPKESLAWAREALLAISRDERLSEAERNERLDRYLEAYLSLTLKLDHAAFPPNSDAEINNGVPEYIPDGFVDLGGHAMRYAPNRDREMIKVDKAGIFKKYKSLLKELFSHNFNGDTLEIKKEKMLSFLAQKVYYDLPHIGEPEDLGGDIVDLSTFSEGVCRHQSLVFQVLAQAAGLKTRLLKCHMSRGGDSLGRHSANMARVEGQWFVLDVSCPDHEEKDGKRIWRPGVFKVLRPPRKGETITYEGTLKYRNYPVKYVAHDDMHWFIDRPN